MTIVLENLHFLFGSCIATETHKKSGTLFRDVLLSSPICATRPADIILLYVFSFVGLVTF
jgi:hypothetical protein